eukprot:Em0013g430a
MAAQNKSTHVFLVTNISPCANDRGLKQYFERFGACYELRYDKPSSQALVTIEGLLPEGNNGARRVSTQQDQSSIANQLLHVTQLFKEDITLRLTDVDQRLAGYIQKLAKERDCVCQKIQSGFDIIGPIGIIDQFRNELLDHALKMNQGTSQDQKVIAAIAAATTWKQLATYLAIPLEAIRPLSASIATEEDGMRAVLKHWMCANPHIMWQNLALVLDKAGRSDISHEIRQCTTPTDQKIIAAIAAVIKWKPLASYLDIPLETIKLPSASIATEEDLVLAVLKQWAGPVSQIPWQNLALVLDKAGRSDISHEIRQCTIPTGPIAEDPGASGYTSNGTSRNITGLSPDVLYLMTKLPEGEIEGVKYDQLDKGCVAVSGSSTGEVDSTIGKFQLVYQNIADKVKVEVVQCPSTLDLASVTKVVESLNRQHKQCVLLQPAGTNAVRIISCAPRQFEQVKVQFQDLLKQPSIPSGVLIPAMPAHISDNDSPLEDFIDLKSYRKLTLKRSNIIKEKVHALVSEVKCDLQCTGRVSGAINAASRDVVQTKLDEHLKKKKGKLADDIVVTEGGGTLQCSHVYHIIEPESTDATQCQAWLGKAVSDVLNWGEKKSIKSVAIPDLSAGGLSKDIVAQVMITTILNHKFTCKPAVMSEIRVVLSDDATYACFAHYFAERKKESAAPLPGAGVSSGDGAANTTTSEGSGVPAASKPTYGFHGADFCSTGSTDSKLAAVESRGLSASGGGSTNQPTASVTEQPVHMRPVSSSSSSVSRKTHHASHSGGSQVLFPSLVDPVGAKPIAMEKSDGALVQGDGSLKCKSATNGGSSSSSCHDMGTGTLDKLMGNQPPGTMSIRQYRWSLPGYEGCGTILIAYDIPDGIQGPEHPSPGARFYGTTRSAYLPDNAEGREVLAMFGHLLWLHLQKTLFEAATESVGSKDDIHCRHLRYNWYGYPDATYLRRVKQELASRGITLDDRDGATM